MIAGFDPGLQNTGWGIISSQNQRISYISSGSIPTNSTQPLATRLLHIQNTTLAILSEHKPYAAAIEDIFVGKSQKSAILLAHARGVIVASLAAHNLMPHPYAPAKIKKTVSGFGHADKQQIIFMIKHILPLSNVSSPDEADALAIAICHAHHINHISSKI